MSACADVKAVPRDGKERGRFGHLAALIQHHHRELQGVQAREGAGGTGHPHHFDLWDQ